MQKIMIKIAAVMLSLLLALGLLFHPVMTQAYTEEQKRQAKAWLSSHGYPPTEDGAWAAYDDWLNGKWWDEFGSPDEYFGVGAGGDEDDEDDSGDEDDDEEQPTAATQKSQGEGSGRSDAETLVAMMAESSVAESGAVETASAVETERAAGTAGEESPTAATQAEMESIFDAAEENTQREEKSIIPFALAGIGAVAVLLTMALILERRKK